MNANRRKNISQIIDKIAELDSLKQQISEMIEDVRNEEEESLDCLPESLQESERGEKMQEAIDNLDNALYEVEGFAIDEILEYLEEAQA